MGKRINIADTLYRMFAIESPKTDQLITIVFGLIHLEDKGLNLIPNQRIGTMLLGYATGIVDMATTTYIGGQSKKFSVS